jgi:branched-subunit amino acid transport protein
MTTLVALLAVGLGSLAYRALPLLGADRVPEGVSRAAGWAGLSVLVAVTVRGVLRHEDPATPGSVVVAVLAVGLGLLLAARRRPMLVVLLAGAGTYVVLSWLLRML